MNYSQMNIKEIKIKLIGKESASSEASSLGMGINESSCLLELSTYGAYISPR